MKYVNYGIQSSLGRMQHNTDVACMTRFFFSSGFTVVTRQWHASTTESTNTWVASRAKPLDKVPARPAEQTQCVNLTTHVCTVYLQSHDPVKTGGRHDNSRLLRCVCGSHCFLLCGFVCNHLGFFHNSGALCLVRHVYNKGFVISFQI